MAAPARHQKMDEQADHKTTQGQYQHQVPPRQPGGGFSDMPRRGAQGNRLDQIDKQAESDGTIAADGANDDGKNE